MAKGSELTLLDEVEKALMDPKAKISVAESSDPDAVISEIVAGILQSDDPLAQSTAAGGRDILGVPILIESVDWRNSDFSGEGLGIFAVVHARDQGGQKMAITCGGRNVLAQLYRLVKDGSLPVGVHFEESKPTARGTTVLWLRASKWEEGGF
jgi:hypothetical protein